MWAGCRRRIVTARDGCAVLVCYLLLAPVDSFRPLAWAWCCPVILPGSDTTLIFVPDAADFLNPLVSRINEPTLTNVLIVTEQIHEQVTIPTTGLHISTVEQDHTAPALKSHSTSPGCPKKALCSMILSQVTKARKLPLRRAVRLRTLRAVNPGSGRRRGWSLRHDPRRRPGRLELHAG